MEEVVAVGEFAVEAEEALLFGGHGLLFFYQPGILEEGLGQTYADIDLVALMRIHHDVCLRRCGMDSSYDALV